MDRQYISDHDVIDRYTLNQLSERELVEFEMYFLEHPEILDEIEIARSLQRGLSANQDALVSKDSSQPAGLLDRLGDWFRSPAILAGNFAVMAALLLLVVIPERTAGPAAYTADRAWIGQVRGESAPLQVSNVAQFLVLDIDVPAAGQYTVELTDENGGDVLSLEQITAVDFALLVVLDKQNLRPGRYAMTITGGDETATLQKEILLSPAN